MLDINALLAQIPAETYRETPGVSFVDQSEPVGLPELHSLGAKLSKQKSEKHAQLGRALLRAVRGEPYAAGGARSNTLYQLAGEIVQAFPNLHPATCAASFEACLSNMTAQSPDDPAPSVRDLTGMLERHQRAKAPAALDQRAFEALILHDAEPDRSEPAAVDARDVPATSAPDRSGPAPRGAFAVEDLRHVIVLADGDYWIRAPNAEHYQIHVKSDRAFRLELFRRFGQGNAVLITHGPDGEMLPTERLLAQYGSNAHRIAHDYSARFTAFDPVTDLGTLTIGYDLTPRTARDHARAAAYDPTVEAWLYAVAGDDPDALADLYDWIAATDQRWISRPAAAAVILGPKDAGKSLLARALAETWRALPVKIRESTERFNGHLAECPIWHIDERMPEDLSDDVFRDLVQARDHKIELKGHEKQRLIGCARLLITVNEIDDVRLGFPNGADALEAISDRLAVWKISRSSSAALEPLRLRAAGSHDADLDRIIAHMRWIQTTITPRVQRFLGHRSGEGANMAHEAALRAVVTSGADVFDLIRAYVQDPRSFEIRYHAEERTFADGMRFPLIVHESTLWYRRSELERYFSAQGIQLAKGWITRTLAPFSGRSKEISLGGRDFRTRFTELHVEQIEQVIRADLSAALAQDTRERIAK